MTCSSGPICRDRIGAIETQRGCNFSCGFCRYRKIGGGARFFDVDRVLREIDILAGIGVDYLYLMDPTFNNNLPRAKKILQHIIDRDMQATLFTEMVPEFMDEELIDLSIRAGMKNLEVGIQSINKPALKVMQRPRAEKKLPERIALAASKEINGRRLNVIPQVIYGLPGEGLSDYLRSFDFVYDLEVEEVAMYHLLVLRDTQFYRDKETHGFIYEADPPHRLIASKTFSRADLVLAAKLSCLAMATQYTLRSVVQSPVASTRSVRRASSWTTSESGTCQTSSRAPFQSTNQKTPPCCSTPSRRSARC